MSDEVITLTHCGKMGDFLYCLPIASWLHKTRGVKIHWVLANGFPPFKYIPNLLKAIRFTDKVTFVDHPIFLHGHGGQPYKFDPKTYGVECGEYYNLGFRGYPDKFVIQFFAEEHGFLWDKDFTLDLGPAPDNGKILRGEQPEILRVVPNSEMWPIPIDLLEFWKLLKGAKERHIWYSGPAAMLYLSRIPFHLHYVAGHPPRSLYLPEEHFGGKLITPVLYQGPP